MKTINISSILPKGWAITKIREVCGLINGRAFKPVDWSNEGVRIQNLNNKDANFNYCNFSVKDEYIINNGQLLFAWSGTPGTSFGAHIWNRGGAILNQHIYRVEINEEFINKIFFKLLLNYNVSDYILKAHGTAGLAHITKKIFEDSLLSLPPYNEQIRIVSKIEELFTKLDAGVEALQKVKKQLKQYRQAVLKHAFEGKLTEEWRKEQLKDPNSPLNKEPASVLLERIKEERKNQAKGKYKELPPIDTKGLPELPEGWVWVYLDNISSKITDGTHHTPKYTETGIHFISVKDIYNRNIHFENCKFISKKEHITLTKRCNPKYNDILITKSGTIGRTAIVKSNREFSLFVSVALIKPYNKYISSEFLAYALDHYINSIDIKQSVKGGLIKNLHIEDLKIIPMRLLHIKEQQKFGNIIDELFEISNKLEFTTELNIEKIYSLKNAILKNAFMGKLVPQDPNDEPAEKLLERLKAEKAKLESIQKSQRKNRIRKNLKQLEIK